MVLIWENFIREFSITDKRYERNTDFIPKFNIDYSKNEKSIDKDKSQEYTIDNDMQERDR